MNPPLIGLTGRAGAGKDTVAAQLVELHGYTRVAFADALKRAAYASNPLVELAPYGDVRRLQYVVDGLGWDAAKRDHADVRAYLQSYGVAIRDELPGCWVNAAGRRIDALLANDVPVVVTDVRFADEVDAIKARHGTMFRVCRPDLDQLDGPNGGHVSETNVDTLPVDYGLWNDGPLSGAVSLADRAHRIATGRRP